MAATDYFEKLLLEHALLGSPFSIQNWYVGLWLADPTPAGLVSGEVTAGDYQRKPISWNPSFGNISQIDWAAAISNWGAVNHIALANSPLKGSGNVLIFEPTSETFDVTIGKALRVPVGGLTVAAV